VLPLLDLLDCLLTIADTSLTNQMALPILTLTGRQFRDRLNDVLMTLVNTNIMSLGGADMVTVVVNYLYHHDRVIVLSHVGSQHLSAIHILDPLTDDGYHTTNKGKGDASHDESDYKQKSKEQKTKVFPSYRSWFTARIPPINHSDALGRDYLDRMGHIISNILVVRSAATNNAAAQLVTCSNFNELLHHTLMNAIDPLPATTTTTPAAVMATTTATATSSLVMGQRRSSSLKWSKNGILDLPVMDKEGNDAWQSKMCPELNAYHMGRSISYNGIWYCLSPGLTQHLATYHPLAAIWSPVTCQDVPDRPITLEQFSPPLQQVRWRHYWILLPHLNVCDDVYVFDLRTRMFQSSIRQLPSGMIGCRWVATEIGIIGIPIRDHHHRLTTIDGARGLYSWRLWRPDEETWNIVKVAPIMDAPFTNDGQRVPWAIKPLTLYYGSLLVCLISNDVPNDDMSPWQTWCIWISPLHVSSSSANQWFRCEDIPFCPSTSAAFSLIGDEYDHHSDAHRSLSSTAITENDNDQNENDDVTTIDGIVIASSSSITKPI
jgi:hypothetical protein